VAVAWRDPDAATASLAAIDAEIAAAATITRALWIRRMQTYREHRADLKALRAQTKADKAKAKANGGK